MCDGKDNNCNGMVDEECFCMDTWTIDESGREIENFEFQGGVKFNRVDLLDEISQGV